MTNGIPRVFGPAFTGNGMMVPIILECCAILMSARNKWCKSQRWCGLSLSKPWSRSNFKKKARHGRANWLPTSTHKRSIGALWVELAAVRSEQEWCTTYVAQRKEPRFGPLYFIIQTATSIFSPPRSPRPRYGAPNLFTASRNMSSTVAALLFVLALNPTTWKHQD